MSTPVVDPADGTPPRPKLRRRLLGQMLLDRGIIDQKQLDEVLLRQKTERGSRVGRLLVDLGPTDLALVEVLAETFRGESYEVITASNGQEALASVHRDRPDLVLTDHQMPVLDGLELLKRLRKDLSTCQIPVVFLTVLDAPDAEAQALDLGADDYVAKGAPRAKLLSRVRRALYKGHLMRSGH